MWPANKNKREKDYSTHIEEREDGPKVTVISKTNKRCCHRTSMARWHPWDHLVYTSGSVWTRCPSSARGSCYFCSCCAASNDTPPQPGWRRPRGRRRISWLQWHVVRVVTRRAVLWCVVRAAPCLSQHGGRRRCSSARV